MSKATILELLSLVTVVIGLFFMIVGAVGVVRLPDVYNRLHAASKCSTLGLLGLLLGAVFHIGTVGMAAKAVMIMLFAFVATPLGVHMLGKAALRTRTPTWPPTEHDADEPTAPPAGDDQPDQKKVDHPPREMSEA
jgi:multicomponent Na+:H+ antiporter subunit G